jgi:hypothetical protein
MPSWWKFLHVPRDVRGRTLLWLVLARDDEFVGVGMEQRRRRRRRQREMHSVWAF